MRFPTIGEDFVGRYRIETVVGAGGFSQVYRARQTDLGRDVAIKVVKPIVDANKSLDEQRIKLEQTARRFDREAKLISRLKDRNTVMMYDYGRTPEGLLYMVLEFVDGITISELIMTAGPLAPERVVKILRQALQSLHEAHSMDVLHRDIKPGNIMVYDHVGQTDLVKVLDFGIAKTVDSSTKPGRDPSTSDVTADGVLVGTPRYMAPEQIRGKKLGPGSDIYSLGLVAYEMLMGTKAVNEDSSLRIIARHLDTDPILVPLNASVPDGLREVVNTMLLKDPSDRYQSCNDVIAALQSWDSVRVVGEVNDPTLTVDGSNISMEVEPVGGPSRGIVAGIVLVLLAIVAMLAFGPTSNEPLADEPPVEVAVVTAPEPEPEIEAADPIITASQEAVRTIIASRDSAAQTAQVTAEYAARDQEKTEKLPPKSRRSPTPTKVKEPEEKKKKKWLFTVD